MITSFYSDDELKNLGVKLLGGGICLSRKVSIYNPERISIGSNVRIDDFCILSGNITIGSHVHIAAYCALFGGNTGIELADFAGVSSRSAIYAESDDYSGNALTNPTISAKYRNVICGKVYIGKHVVIGTGSSILPGVCIEEGTALGSRSLVCRSLEAWGIYAGIPCKRLKERSRKILELEKSFLDKESKDIL